MSFHFCINHKVQIGVSVQIGFQIGAQKGVKVSAKTKVELQFILNPEDVKSFLSHCGTEGPDERYLKGLNLPKRRKTVPSI